MGAGVKKQIKESGSLLDDDSNTSLKPRKKSRVATRGPKSRGAKSTGVSRGAKGAKVMTPRMGAKGKLPLDYDSDNLLWSNDSTPKATIIKNRSDSAGKHSIKELLKKIEEKDKEIRLMELELSKSKVTSRMNKTKVQEELKWTGEEINFAEMVNHFCQNFLFPKIQVPQEWMEGNSAR